ncbi:sensor domain-containing diguanylate cyclase [Bengtsoniella intestinalis]|uniref:sensor domain-containing diguanylate cyclase n=1 Tax=Bengtsoniella intestinalis TaxID=3073143 RepID=UPI00391F3005
MNTPMEGLSAQQMAVDYELYHYGAQFTEDIFFKIDIINTTVMFLGNNLKQFKSREIIPDYINLVEKSSLIYHEDKELFAQAVADLTKGIQDPIKFRLHYPDGTIVWYHAQYTILKDETGKPISAVGKINNIQQTQDLTDKANQDMLTSCLNKGAFEGFAKALMNPQFAYSNDQHTFFIIDIDNFKAVNDNLGHFFGDIVLKEISAKLKRIFRESDWIGRIGGDEFAVVMKHVDDEKLIEKKAQEILTALDTTYQGKNTQYRISGSVGVATYPRHGHTYDDIYQNADSALYHSKFNGKNTFTVFHQALIKGTMINTTPFDVADRALSHFFDKEVAMDTFNLLFENEQYEASVMSVLGYIGEYYHVDRCYIFELQAGTDDTYDNTYEWCRDGITPQRDFLQNVDKSEFDELFGNANADGIFYCNELDAVKDPVTHDTLAMQGIKSFLLSFVKKNDIVNYAIGFDDCTSERIWSPSEISTLMYASKIISQFLAYQQALKTVESHSKDNLEVLDALNFYAYIVDTEEHTLKYLNDVTRQLVPEAEVGKKCYHVLRGNDCECADCPLRVLRENPAHEKVKMIIHNQKLNLDVLVTASKLISYDGKKSVFVSSTDIREIVNFIPEKDRNFSDFIVLE